MESWNQPHMSIQKLVWVEEPSLGANLSTPDYDHQLWPAHIHHHRLVFTYIFFFDGQSRVSTPNHTSWISASVYLEMEIYSITKKNINIPSSLFPWKQIFTQPLMIVHVIFGQKLDHTNTITKIDITCVFAVIGGAASLHSYTPRHA